LKLRPGIAARSGFETSAVSRGHCEDGEHATAARASGARRTDGGGAMVTRRAIAPNQGESFPNAIAMLVSICCFPPRPARAWTAGERSAQETIGNAD
jgi:hypothetical protein